ncbi:MAG: hypothetical protein AB7I59_17485 [Geminicoccaceae bacterium]
MSSEARYINLPIAYDTSGKLFPRSLLKQLRHASGIVNLGRGVRLTGSWLGLGTRPGKGYARARK